MKLITLLLFLVLFSATDVMADEIPQPRQNELIYLLRQDCGACHGMTLQGGLGPPLLPQTLANKPEALLLNTILAGRPNTAMPPWRDFLTATEANWLLKKLLNGINNVP
ncbi:c-type cytochrome c55x [Thioploca ingrica]|uniref:C-type cytochrome c55x n=1 Tax=Thioploca ingrica TaxID=40754 RepID=A0A090AG58_9GAMM|nr:c-type cytochrome c55x [Thioploca ingrica]